jgi:hypothetical protein
VRGGEGGANKVFQICYLTDHDHLSLLERLDERYNSPDYRRLYGQNQAKLLFTNLQHSRYHQFNQFIENGELAPLVDEDGQYGLIVGNSFTIGQSLIVNLYPNNFENLLVIGDNEEMAKSIFVTSVLSVLYEELSEKDVSLDDQLIRILDLSTPSTTEIANIDDLADLDLNEAEKRTTSFANLQQLFPNQVKVTSGRADRFSASPILTEIDELYQLLQRRIAGEDESANERVLVGVFGLNRATILTKRDVQAGGTFGDIGPLEKLQFLLTNGPQHNMPVMVWGQTLESTERLLNANAALPAPDYFNARIVFGQNPDLPKLLNDPYAQDLSESAAAYQNQLDAGDAIHFRPYTIPPLAWSHRFAMQYQAYVDQNAK